MFRALSAVISASRHHIFNVTTRRLQSTCRTFPLCPFRDAQPSNPLLPTTSLLSNPAVVQLSQSFPLTKFSLQKGKRKTCKPVLKRFYRLHWGGWIRTIAGRHKKIWKKSPSRRRRLRQHVMVSATQSWLLDKMVTRYWRKPKHWVDDPYQPYHSRDEFAYTRRKPA